jgi:hypothetical protein
LTIKHISYMGRAGEWPEISEASALSNMDDFNEATALILAKLYESFPQRQSFEIARLVEGADDNKRLNYLDTILFLAREGFIRYEGIIATDSVKNVTLTLKGLAVLNETPDVLKEKTPLGTKLMGVVGEGSREVVRAVVQEVLKIGISYLS